MPITELDSRTLDFVFGVHDLLLSECRELTPHEVWIILFDIVRGIHEV